MTLVDDNRFVVSKVFSLFVYGSLLHYANSFFGNVNKTISLIAQSNLNQDKTADDGCLLTKWMHKNVMDLTLGISFLAL